MAIASGLEDAHPIVVEGMPGTGKTILAIYLLKLLKDDPKYKGLNVRLLEPVTSLRNTLRSALSTVSGLSPDDIIGPADLIKPEYGYTRGGGASFDIVFVDEAHRLERRVNLGTQFHNYDLVNEELGLSREAMQVDWILNQVKLPIFFYDSLQAVGPSCVPGDSIRETLGSAMLNPITLDSQMRVKGGKEYLNYIADILDEKNPAPKQFEGYDLIFHDDIESFAKSFEADYQAHNLSRTVAGYAWKWASKKDRNAFDIEIDDVRLRWNCTYDNWVGRGLSNDAIAHEVGCIHSIQGYDLSYAYVLIGNDLTLDPETGRLAANRSSYFDRNGFATATPEELTQYIKNIYYVLLTRGIFGTHIYVVDDGLRGYLRGFSSSH